MASWSDAMVGSRVSDDSDSSGAQTRRLHTSARPTIGERHMADEPLARIVHSKVPNIPLPPPPVARKRSVGLGPLNPALGSFVATDGAPLADYSARMHKYSLDTTSSTVVESHQIPPAVHRGSFHHSANSLPVNVALAPTPPIDPMSSAVPSAPPIARQVPTFYTTGHMRSQSGGSAGSDTNISDAQNALRERGASDRYASTRVSESTPEDVRMVAINDAHTNMSLRLFSDKVLNFRDIGVSVIKAGLQLHQDRAKAERVGPMPGVVFRSAELGSAGEHDVKMLFSKYGIRTIIDLRSELEARASDIIMKHYPASIQPTADQSMERLMRLRASQVQKTIVEVAAHSYESAARPWERTGESRTSWSHRNSLRYTKSIGDPNKDPLARALMHLYDDIPEEGVPETHTITLDEPYVPLCTLPALDIADSHQASSNEHLSDAQKIGALPKSAGEISAQDPVSLQHPGLAQSALDWGSETLQMMRSYLDQPWTGPAAQKPAPPEVCPAGADNSEQGASSSQSSSLSSVAKDAVAAGLASLDNSDNDADAESSSDGDDFYRNSPSDVNRKDMPYGLLPVSQIERPSNPLTLEAGSSAKCGSAASTNDLQHATLGHPRSRATTEPIFVWHQPAVADTETNLEPDAPVQRIALKHNAPHSELPGLGVSKLSVQNKFNGQRTRYRCNLIGENYRKRCVWAHTPWSTRIKVIWRFATFNKAEAIRTIGREVLAPRGLTGSYEDYVDYCKEEFAAVMRIFADPCAYPILFHCQHGKDRTGIVAMLLLGILGVDDDVIAADYARSQGNLEPVRQRMELLEMGAVGLPPAFCDSPEFVMRSLLRHIKSNYGSVRGYLRSAGMKEQEINTIAWCLRGNFCGIVHAKSRMAHAEARSLYLRPSAARSSVFNSPPTRKLPQTPPPPPTID
ncbi:hypothetical protein GGI02_001304 [Coemansia sp. RSA 2322]|nr:hypothetical protein GGI02_001304 [Coemansia sp. RSA 2322]